MAPPKTVVGIDIETTSLDSKQGDIIEVAAIRFDFKTGKELDRFERLTASRHPISREITSLTGITSEMLEGKRPFAEHVEELQDFIGGDIVFAHNAQFDVGWLADHGCDLNNPVWDTFALATIAWPEAPTYNLGSLAADARIEIEGEHRAAQDIALTWQLLLKMKKQLVASAESYAKVAQALQASRQDHYLTLFAKHHSAPKNNSTQSVIGKKRYPKNIDSLLGEGGYLSSNVDGFSYRPEQQLRAQHVEQWIKGDKAGLIEAGTGIGKTYAYVIPCLLHTKRALISTYTRTLQDQLVEKDIPEILASLGEDKKVATLKGRGNYVCTTRLDQYLSRDRLRPDEAWVLLKILLWLDAGGSGDLERLNFSHQGQHVTRLLSADSAACRLKCKTGNSGCPYQQARQKAEESEIIVTNHALLLQLASQEEDSINYDAIVVDEAHHLEDAALSASQIDFSFERIGEIAASLLQTSKSNQQLSDECQAIMNDYQSLLKAAAQLQRSHTGNTQLRITKAVRGSSGWGSWATQANSWLGRLRFAIGLTRSLGGQLEGDQLKVHRDALQQAEQLSIQLDQFMSGDQERVQWLECMEKEDTAHLKDSAVLVSHYIQPLVALRSALVLTSATLTTNGSFAYIKERYGLEDIEAVQLSSSFDLQEQMAVLVSDTGPEPGSPRFSAHTARIIGDIALKTRGRLLGLFTSQEAVKDTYYKLINTLNKEKIRLYAQKITGGRHNIAKRFKDQDSSVLLGTSSFWEGIDLPGESLSVVVIPKLPFPRLNDPIVESLSERAGRRQAFHEVMLPRMIIRLKQGMGRLIRSHNDRGVVVLLDSRLAKKEYGQQVLHSLPAAPVEIVPAEEIPQRVEKWFGLETINRWQDKDKITADRAG